MKKKLKIFLIFICLGLALLSYQKTKMMPIPKKIHYVWLGSKEEPKVIKMAVERWKKMMPDYEIKRWDETNCNLNANDFIKKAYKEKRWDYASDWCRLEALYEEGGIYLDTDMVLNRHLGDLMVKNLVVTLESKGRLSGGIFAVSPKHPYIKRVKDYYQNYGREDYVPNPRILQYEFDIYKNFNDDYIVYPTNVLMLDFGGEENYAKHLYASGTLFFRECRYYYRHFQNGFLNDEGYCIKNCENPSLAIYVLFLENNRFYLVRQQNKGCFYADSPKIEGVYSLKEGEQKLLVLQYDDGKKEQYLCQKNKCQIE